MEERKIELFIPGELKDEPIICDMVRRFDGDFKIIEASFSAESGWAILVVKGKKDELDKMFEYLREKGINVETR